MSPRRLRLLVFVSSSFWQGAGFGLRQQLKHEEKPGPLDSSADRTTSRTLVGSRRTGVLSWNSEWIEPSGLVRGRDTLQSVPTENLEGYENLWWRTETDPDYGDPIPRDDVKLVVGVFSIAEQKGVRDVLRRTWMNHSWICSTTSVDSEGCVAHVTFVLGEAPKPAVGDIAKEDDLTILGIPENMDDGKTAAWFQKALSAFPWATHIAKMDQDAFPHFDVLTKRMPAFGKAIVAGRTCPNFYAGSWWSCFKKDDNICPPVGCRYPLGNNFMEYEWRSADCFSYMQGAFYFMSRELAQGVVDDGYWNSDQLVGHAEDAVTGLAIKKYAERTGSCVGTVDMAGTFHHLGPMRSGPNDIPEWLQ